MYIKRYKDSEDIKITLGLGLEDINIWKT
jgi:hypothetical protein